jgi:hypothetical protein
VAFHSDRGGKYYMAEPTGVTTKEEGDERDAFFNDLDIIKDDDVPFYVRVHYDDEKIVNIMTFYKNGRVIIHGVQTPRSKSGIYLYERTHGNNIEYIRLEAQKYKSRTLVDMVSIATNTGIMFVSPDKRAHGQAVVNPATLHLEGWNFRGFYGFITDDGGITGLGTIFAKLTEEQTHPRSLPPLLYQDKDSPIPGSALAKLFTSSEDKGRFYRASPCYNESKDTTVSAFSMIERVGPGDMPQTLEFYKDKNTPLQGIRALKLTWTNQDPETYPATAKVDGLTAEVFEIAKSRVTKAKCQFRKLPSGKFCLTYVYLELESGSPFKAGFELSTEDNKAGGFEKWIMRPDPLEAKSWSLGGLFGQSDNDYIISLGLFWVRDF